MAGYTYVPDVADIKFVLHTQLQATARFAAAGAYSDFDADTLDAVLDSAAQVATEVLSPVNRVGDETGAQFDGQGNVRTPEAFQGAWRAIADGGWVCVSAPPEHGGMGLPHVLHGLTNEMFFGAASAFMMYPGLTSACANMMMQFAPPLHPDVVLSKLVSGAWAGTMCLTEAGAGSDVGANRCKATRTDEEGVYLLEGEKIFISGGDHDMTENIAHIVLAKVPDESGRLAPGLASVSVFLVPKRRINPQTGESGELNGVQVRALEHKMGIEGSATCAMSFENAEGWRISDERRSGSSANMAPMFLLMNYARVSTAMSGVGYGECALQLASAYARERLSGRAHGQPRRPDLPADPIIVHADVRRQLLDTRAFVEAARAGAMQAALWQSLAEHHPDPQQRQEAGDLLDLLTPVMKAYFTDSGFEAAVACQQVLGGHGYIRDHGIEQIVRNARIGQLYEGANGIQAVDLLRRKLTAHGGRAGQTFLGRIDALLARHAHRADLQDLLPPLAAARARLGQTLDWLAERVEREPEGADAGAYDLLTAMGIVYLGWIWVEQAACVGAASRPRFIGEQEALRKSHLARLWMQRQMPLVHGRCDRIQSGNAAMLAVPEAMI